MKSPFVLLKNIFSIKHFKIKPSLYYFRKTIDLIFYKSENISPPLRMQIELTSQCNYRCGFCYLGHYNRKVDFMSFENVKKIINESRVRYFQFNGVGETLLHPKIDEIFLYAKSRRAIVKFTTNGFLLRKETSQAIVDSGVDTIEVSIDTTDKELYPQIRVGGNLEKVLDNITYLKHYRDKKRGRLRIIAYFVYNKNNIHHFEKDIINANKLPFDDIKFELIEDLFKKGNFYKIDNRDELIEVVNKALKKKMRFSRSLKEFKKTLYNAVSHRICYNSVYLPYVMVGGTLLPCCGCAMWTLENDKNRLLFEMGNVIQQDFQKVWNSPKARQVRNNILENREHFGYCAKCKYSDFYILYLINRISKINYRLK